MRHVTYEMIRAVRFTQAEGRGLGRLAVPVASHRSPTTKSFFYPVYHFGDVRWAWGRKMTYWSAAGECLSSQLEMIHAKFRPGSSISIFFSVGFALAVASDEGIEYYRVERPHGFGASIADALGSESRLVRELSFFRERQSARACIDWACENIVPFGRWESATTFRLEPSLRPPFNASRRYFTNAEIEFLSRKLKVDRYAEEMTKEYFLGSPAWSRMSREPEASRFKKLRTGKALLTAATGLLGTPPYYR